MTKNQKLELTWIGKEKRPKLEARILLEDAAKSYHAPTRSEQAIFDNRLIFGDNLLALKALEQEFAGKVKCVFIDPPYNTGSAFAHYDDGLEHSIWLGLMRDRLEIIKRLLADDGSLWITIGDDEVHYLKVLCDEVFGRTNFINEISLNIKNVAGASGGGEDKKLKKNIEYILVYAKDYMKLEVFKNSYSYTPIIDIVEQYREEGRSWKYTTALINAGEKEFVGTTLDGDGNEIKIYKRINPVFKSINYLIKEEKISEEEAYMRYASLLFQTAMPQSSIRPRVMEKVQELGISHDFFSIEYIPRSGRNKGVVYEQFYKGDSFRLLAWLKDVSEEIDGILYKRDMQGNYWDFVRETKNLTKEGGVQFPNGKKPEALLRQIFDMCTNPNDLILDSFAGSGTTGAVAHKMGRRWIMVELGEHCHTHIIPRLQKVIDGTDQGGISKAVNWQGGGGFRYYRLAPTLIVNDAWGNPVINPDYNPEMLAEALAKLEGFTYRPSETLWWQHGFSSERDFIYVTTQNLSAEQLQALSDEVGENQSLLVCCAAWRGITAAQAAERFPNLSLKKIPKMVLARCEWGHDDYSLNVANLPMAEPEPMPSERLPESRAKAAKGKSAVENQEDLFAGEAGDE